MNANSRKALYALIPLIITMLTAYGVLTDALGALWLNVATLAVGLGYAASKATGNRLLDPGVRRALYVLIPAAVALVGGYISIDAALWTSLILGVLGACLAVLNVDPDEQLDPDFDEDFDA